MDPTDAIIEKLPDEVLVKIFGILDFRQLMRVSTVNRRWNRLVFGHFEEKIVLQLNCNDFKIIPGSRRYRTVYLLEFGALKLIPENVRRLEELGKEVRFAEFFSDDVSVEWPKLVQLLHTQSGVERINLHVWTLLSEEKSKESIERSVHGMLPNVSNLGITGRFAAMSSILAEVSTRLHTLDVAIYPHLQEGVHRCDFPLLHTLTVRMMVEKIIESKGFFPTEDLMAFLRRLTTVKTLTVYIDETRLLPELFCLKQIEKLTFGPTDTRSEMTVSLAGIEKMTKLRWLYVGATAITFPSGRLPTVPSLEELVLKETTDLPELLPLFEMFPNIWGLHMPSRMFSTVEIPRLVSVWPGLRELTLCMPQAYGDCVRPLARLAGLRKLGLWCCHFNEDYSGLEDIIRKPTMREIRINRGYRQPMELFMGCMPPDDDVAFGEPDRVCEIFYNGVHIPRHVRQ